MSYSWTDNPTKVSVASCNTDILNECLMHLKYGQKDLDFALYSVNSALKDANGCADFINKESDSEISFSVDDGTNYEPLMLTYPDGSSVELLNLNNIDSGIVDDATNYIIFEKDKTEASLVDGSVNSIIEAFAEPSNSVDGDFWLDISSKPYQPYKKVSSQWVETQFVKLGEVKKTNGTLGTPISYALNGVFVQKTPKTFVGTTYNAVFHNLGYEADLINSLVFVRQNSSYNWGRISEVSSSGQTASLDSLQLIYKIQNYEFTVGQVHVGMAAGCDVAGGELKTICRRAF